MKIKIERKVGTRAKQLTLTVTEEMYYKINKIAQREQTTMSQIITFILKNTTLE